MANRTNNNWPIPKHIERARSVTTWQKVQFSPSDAEQHRRNPTGEVILEAAEIITTGWDHEHCMLCMAKIAQLPDCQREGYSNDERNLWLCVACYGSYVSPSKE